MAGTFEVVHGDCLEVMRGMDAASVDAIVTDPPYGLSFMGKDWDHGVPGVHFWEAALHVAKPGTHLLAFGGTRTFHRLACAIEDAGWEIRDTMMWVYGSGFPKSLDVSKAIDKVNGETDRLLKFTRWMRTTGLTAKEINDATGTFMGSHYLTDKTQPAIPTVKLWAMLRPLCGLVPEWVDRLVERIEAEREVVGVRQGVPDTSRVRAGFSGPAHSGEFAGATRDIPITAPATDLARKWSGWGTALKPAYEPIIVARKPLAGTVAANVIQHGTGAINVDGCRIPSGGEACTGGARDGSSAKHTHEGWNRPWKHDPKACEAMARRKAEYEARSAQLGRWPANLIHDGSEEVVGPMGSAARFFYCAKASKADRDGGNAHPTVKPTALMRYLCRLVTPPGGVVLDPFAGSGSTGVACMREGLRFVGCELGERYAEVARARLQHAYALPRESGERVGGAVDDGRRDGVGPARGVVGQQPLF